MTGTVVLHSMPHGIHTDDVRDVNNIEQLGIVMRYIK